MASVYRVFVEKLGGADAATFVGNAGELFWDPTTQSLKISDGTTAGGQPLSSSLQGTMTGSIIPDTNDAYDIGSAEFKIRDLYVSDGSIHTESGNNLSFYDGNLTWGGDEVIMLNDLKEMMATATSFEDFKNTIMDL